MSSNKLIFDNQNKKMKENELINITRFLLLLGVIFLHSGININELNNIHEITFGTIILQISNACVPCFFIISGFLFFINTYNFSLQIYVKKIQSRIRTLFIPYIIWNVIALVPFIFITPKNEIISCLSNHEYIKILQIFWKIDNGVYPLNFPLWYLRDLMIMSLLTPIIYYIIKYTKFYIITLLMIIFIFNIFPQTTIISIKALLFFSIGAFLGIYKIDFIYIIEKNKSIILLLFAICLIISLQYNNLIITKNLCIIICCGSFFAFTALIKQNKIKNALNVMSKSSFFIYATHALLIVGYCSAIIRILFSWSGTFYTYINIIFTPILTIFVCYSIYLCLKLTVPKLLNIITGNR